MSLDQQEVREILDAPSLSASEIRELEKYLRAIISNVIKEVRNERRDR